MTSQQCHTFSFSYITTIQSMTIVTHQYNDQVDLGILNKYQSFYTNRDVNVIMQTINPEIK